MMRDKPGKYRYLEHTADLKFQAFGFTLEEAFINAAYAMFNYLIDPEKIKPINKYEITKEAETKEALLYDFLDELIFLIDTKGMVLSRIDFIKIEEIANGFKLRCVLFGDSYKNYQIHGDIKAVTYHEMEINDSPGNVIIQVVIDI